MCENSRVTSIPILDVPQRFQSQLGVGATRHEVSLINEKVELFGLKDNDWKIVVISGGELVIYGLSTIRDLGLLGKYTACLPPGPCLREFYIRSDGTIETMYRQPGGSVEDFQLKEQNFWSVIDSMHSFNPRYCGTRVMLDKGEPILTFYEQLINNQSSWQ